MKKELWHYGFYYLAIILAVIVSITSGMSQNWTLMLWVICALGAECLALRNLKEKDRIERKYIEALGGKG